MQDDGGGEQEEQGWHQVNQTVVTATWSWLPGFQGVDGKINVLLPGRWVGRACAGVVVGADCCGFMPLEAVCVWVSAGE
jgi:hypothetical protein